jgi:hypothetical protein
MYITAESNNYWLLYTPPPPPRYYINLNSSLGACPWSTHLTFHTTHLSDTSCMANEWNGCGGISDLKVLLIQNSLTDIFRKSRNVTLYDLDLFLF